MDHAPVLPVSRAEMDALGWNRCDVVIVSGDAYVDHPSFGAALIGRYLESLGYRVGIIPQPDVVNVSDVLRLGVPRLFVGITSGVMDSMVSHYTSLHKPRSDDAYSPGGRPGKRPDRALLRYVNLVQRAMPGIPVVIGGIEASLRRFSHYDFWSDKVRKSILLDTKATVLVYGMGEKAVAEIAAALDGGRIPENVRGTVTYADAGRFGSLGMERYVELPSHEDVSGNPAAFMEMTRTIERESNPWCGSVLVQKADRRVVIAHPPAFPLSSREMDHVYGLPFSGVPHPSYREVIPAYEMIRNSITVVRGCAGGCSFCALGLHQGRFVSSRSPNSVIAEVGRLTRRKDFRGTVSDLGGPTANLYGLGCRNPDAMRSCRRNSCLYPDICVNFDTDHSEYVELLDRVSAVGGVRNVYISSGIRYDVAIRSRKFLEKLVRNHVPGYLKVAPEHFSASVLELMRKPHPGLWRRFKKLFDGIAGKTEKKIFIRPYLMAAFPGCTVAHAVEAARELEKEGLRPEAVQIFLPTPMTMATAMYHTGLHPETGEPLEVARKPSEKKRRLAVLLGRRSGRPRA